MQRGGTLATSVDEEFRTDFQENSESPNRDLDAGVLRLVFGFVAHEKSPLDTFCFSSGQNKRAPRTPCHSFRSPHRVVLGDKTGGLGDYSLMNPPRLKRSPLN